MRLYRVAYKCEGGNSGGFSWHPSKRLANAESASVAKRDADDYVDGPPVVEAFDVGTTKKGLLRFLREHASYPDNG